MSMTSTEVNGERFADAFLPRAEGGTIGPRIAPGALCRKAPGVRVSLAEYFGRRFLAGMNTSKITQAMLDRNPPAFAQLVRSSIQMEGVGSIEVQAAKETLYG